MNNVNWKEIATNILEQEKILGSGNYPKAVRVLVKWNDNIYIGSIQEIVPEFSKEIVLLSKSTCGLPIDLVNMIKELDNKRLELNADESLDLDGRQHILRRMENRLVHMSPQQTEYMTIHTPNIFET